MEKRKTGDPAIPRGLAVATRARDPRRGPKGPAPCYGRRSMSLPEKLAALTWTVADAALQMGLSTGSVRRLIRRGELPGCYQTRRYTNTGPGGTILRRIAWRVPHLSILGWQAKEAAKAGPTRRPAGPVNGRTRPRRGRRRRRRPAQGASELKSPGVVRRPSPSDPAAKG